MDFVAISGVQSGKVSLLLEQAFPDWNPYLLFEITTQSSKELQVGSIYQTYVQIWDHTVARGSGLKLLENAVCSLHFTESTQVTSAEFELRQG